MKCAFLKCCVFKIFKMTCFVNEAHFLVKLFLSSIACNAWILPGIMLQILQILMVQNVTDQKKSSRSYFPIQGLIVEVNSPHFLNKLNCVKFLVSKVSDLCNKCASC